MDHPWRHNGPRKRPLDERLREKTDMSGGPAACWPWIGARNSRGRAVIQLDRRTVYVTRLLFTLQGRPLAVGEFACHRCDNPACVNPIHLFAGDHQANMSDMATKGRASHAPKSTEQRAKAGASISAAFAANPQRHPERRKVACPLGHAYASENLRVDRRGHRHCRTCDRRRNREASQRGHASPPSSGSGPGKHRRHSASGSTSATSASVRTL